MIATLGLAAALGFVACSAVPRRVAVAELWGVPAGQTIATTGMLTFADPASCSAELVDGSAHVSLETTGPACAIARAASGRRVGVEGTVSIGAAMPDTALRPHATGCEPFVELHATRVHFER